MTTNDTLAEMFKQAPLIRFSVYSHGQVQIIQSLSTELIQLLDSSITKQEIDGQNFHRIYGLFWLWVLGAYETTRTMSEYSVCFSDRLNTEITSFKRRISVLRMPFAKLQFQGGDKRPINGEASVYGIDLEKKDLSFKVGGTVESVRTLLAEFERFTQQIEPADVLHDLREADQLRN
jgi:hypothetical protein